ncbi:MAG TPA: hypothetical protein VLL52_24230 [Anaerolineae bacterium]|nr:hypothetical protein [Anaerolineae bacterium]
MIKSRRLKLIFRLLLLSFCGTILFLLSTAQPLPMIYSIGTLDPANQPARDTASASTSIPLPPSHNVETFPYYTLRNKEINDCTQFSNLPAHSNCNPNQLQLTPSPCTTITPITLEECDTLIIISTDLPPSETRNFFSPPYMHLPLNHITPLPTYSTCLPNATTLTLTTTSTNTQFYYLPYLDCVVPFPTISRLINTFQ